MMAAFSIGYGQKINVFGVELTIEPSYINGELRVQLDKKYHDVEISKNRNSVNLTRKGGIYEHR